MLQCCPLLTTDTIASPQGDTCCMSSDTNPIRVFAALYDIAVATGGVLEPVELARVVVNRARSLLEAGAVGVYGLNESTQLLEPIYSSDARDALPEPPIPIGTGAAGQALLRGQLVRVNDYLNWPHAGWWAAANGVRSAMAVPLQVADRRTGPIPVRTYVLRSCNSDDAQTLMLGAALI